MYSVSSICGGLSVENAVIVSNNFIVSLLCHHPEQVVLFTNYFNNLITNIIPDLLSSSFLELVILAFNSVSSHYCASCSVPGLPCISLLTVHWPTGLLLLGAQL